jgi:hypothetical protein
MSWEWGQRVRSQVLRGAAVVAVVCLAPALILLGWCFWLTLYAFAFLFVITSRRRTLFTYSEKCDH